MKKLITYLKTLWRRGLDSQSTDVRHDCRLTVSSPSGLKSSTLLKFVSVLVLVLTIGIGNVWGTVNNGDLFERISAAPAANDEVIFVNQAETHACGTTQNTNNRTPVAITTSSNQYIYNSSNNVQVFVVKINSSGKFGFHTGSGYIYSASSSKNYLKTNSTAASTDPATTAAWTLLVSSSVFSATNVSNTSYYLAFNGTDYFSQYKSGQSKPYIYKKVMSAPTAVAASSITSSGATITITDATNVNNYELYYSTSSTAPTAGSSATTTITGGKSKSITGLNASTTYYVWARAYSTSPARKTGWVALTGTSFTTSAGASVAVTSVSVTPTSKSIVSGETFSITPTVLPANATDKSVSWTSSATSYATVSSGTVTGVAAGSSTITCKTNDGNFTATCAVTVRAVTLQARDEDGNAIGVGGPGAPTRSGTTITAAANAGNYVFKQWDVTNATVAASGTTPTTISNPTGAVTVTAVYYKPITITYKANGSTFTTQTYARGGTLAFPNSNPDGATYSCTGKTFVGWVGEANKDYSDASTPPTYATAGGSVTAAATYYAVFADATPGGISWTQTTSVSVGDSVIIAEIDHVADGKTGKELTSFSTTSTIYGLAADFASTPAGTKKWKVVAGYNSTGVAFQDGSNYLYWASGNSLNVNSPLSANTSWTVTTESSRAKIANNSTTTRVICWNSGSPRFATYDNKDHGEEISNGSSTYYYYPVFYKKTGGVTYSNYATSCCTELGSINGSVSWSNAATAVVSWDNLDHVSSWTVKYKTHAAGAYTTWAGEQSTAAGRRSVTITGLAPCTNYDFQIIANPASGYCDKNQTIEDSQTHNWTVTSTITNGTKTSVPTTACGDYTATFAVTSGYHFPAKANVSVTGASDFSWNSSTGVLSIDGEDITGNISISITCPPDACSDWGFYYGTDKVADWAYECFTKVKPADATDHEWQTDEIALPNKPNWYVDNATEDDGKKKLATWSELYFAASQGDGARPMVGTATGATGKVRIYDNWDWNNRAAGFLPTGYVMKFGSTEYPFAFVASNEYRTDIVDLNSTTYADVVSVGIEDGSGDYVSTGNTEALRHVFFVPSAAWKTGSAKFCIHYWDGESLNARSNYMSAVPGKSGWYEGWLPTAATGFQFERQNPAGSEPTEGNRWTAGENQTLQSNKNCYTMTASGGESDWTGTITTSLYTSKGKFRMWDNSTSKNWYVTFYPHYVLHFDANSGTGAPADQSVALDASPCQLTVSSTVPTRDGYTFLGWNESSSATTPDGNWDGGDTHAMTGDVTLYAVWAANHTLSYSLDGGDGSCSGGTYYTGQLFTACNNPGDKTGHSFTGWLGSNSTSYTAGTTYSMPDADLTLTAQWSANSYDVTLTTNGGTINAGNVTSYTYGTGATLPTNVTRDGYRFDGWFSDDGVWSDQVTAISTTATGDKTYYAKWTQVYTVTWYVNGEEWSSGVVSGNTQVPSGTKVSALPTAPTTSDCDDSKVFVGWRATAIDGTSTSDPGGIFTTQAGSPAITGKTTFYAVFADASPRQVISLTFPDDNSDNNGLTSNQYTSEWTAKAGTFSFTVNNFNNNNWANSWEWIKCGRKNNTSVAKITTDTDVDFRVDSVYITIGSIADSYVNSAKLQISSSSDFGTKTEMDIPQSTGTQKLKIASPATDKYYRIVYDCASHTSNGFVQINSLEFIQKSETSNYVTSCSSCDADATFTNTTPAVSDIDCTSATLTATGGLATVGADGCHVSDYGFVIGTSDNPAIGGSGVEKLQVGTSDPTIGEDFSYDATGLTKGTQYYIRAYAINRHGTAYSSSQNFWTKDVSSIAITTAPTKTNYIVGETFDATGMVVTATMASGSTEAVTGDVTYSESALTAGASQNFPVNYTLCETEKSVNQVINVYTLSVTEGTNPSYGTATNSSANIVSITGLGDHKTYTVTVTSSNATAVDNGDNTWSIINPTGNVTVLVDYADAVQVKVYYKVDGVTVTGLTQDVYQSETTTLPTASALATAMTAQSMDIPDDDYPNFYGWSETEFPAQTAEPTIVTGTPTINAEKTYYAVYTNLSKKQILPSDFAVAYATNEGAKTIDGLGYNIHDICLQSSKIQFRNTPGYLYSTSALSYIKKIEITGLDLVVNACSDALGTVDGSAITPTGTGTYVYTFPASKQYFKIKGKGGTDKVSLIEIFYASSTVYYMTQFCTNRVTLTQNSPEHGTVEFGRSSLVTCGSDKNVSLTIIPDVGYQLTGWTVNTSSGYADAKTTSPAVVTNSNNSAAQNITLTFAEDANKDYDVTATFGLMTVTSWAWTLNSAAIPDPLNLYIGQSARLDVAYTPAGVDASKKTYGRTKEDAYINWVGVAQSTYTTISGRASTGENTTPVTFTHGDGPTTTVNVKVLPLPAVHFGDIVHNVSFDDVVATLSDNTLSPTKTTPTHADFEGSTANQCEEQHLHLVGWIREDWPALVTYLNGGSKPSTSDITTAGDDASGNAYFFAPGASINTQTFNGVTFYAVWAKVE